jgi:hypothetical protein
MLYVNILQTKAVSRQTLTVVAGFDPRPGHVGFVLKSGTGASFLQILQFPLPFLIPPAAAHP